VAIQPLFVFNPLGPPFLGGWIGRLGDTPKPPAGVFSCTSFNLSFPRRRESRKHTKDCPLIPFSTPLIPHSWGREKKVLRDTLRLPAAFCCTIITFAWVNALAPTLGGRIEIWGHPKPPAGACPAPLVSITSPGPHSRGKDGDLGTPPKPPAGASPAPLSSFALHNPQSLGADAVLSFPRRRESSSGDYRQPPWNPPFMGD